MMSHLHEPKDLIDDIRKSVYGIGLPPNPVVDELRKQLASALHLLSQDLFSKDIHFVLELIQNAEDNAYEPAVYPELRFLLDGSSLLVQNNEVGFSPDQVRALCAVGKSTKSNKRLGYIGEKGIGFKSVFRVTNEPHIYSNGFRFSLPIHDSLTKLGYVIPVWQVQQPPNARADWTNIVLPLTEKGQTEAQKIAQVPANLLLFLRKLRRIEIRLQASDESRVIEREGDGPNVTLRTGDATEQWRLVRRSEIVPPGMREEKRQNVVAVEEVFAFPLTQNGDAQVNVTQHVYSFLPVRHYGFRFAIQSDFILTANREDIHGDLPWNQWLRDCIPCLFLEAVEHFKADPKLRNDCLSFAPLPEEIQRGFFQEVPQQIIGRLKGAACILTASGKWSKPTDVLLIDEASRRLFSYEDVEVRLGKHLIHEQFAASAQLLNLLGISQFGFADVVQCLADTQWLETKGDSWLVELFAYLNRTWSAEAQEELRKLRLVPLENGKFDCTAGGDIFLPLDRRSSYGFEHEMRVVKKGLWKANNTQSVKAAREFLKSALGVRSPEPSEIINKHILPVYEGTDATTNWKSKNVAFLLGTLDYIKDHVDQFVDGGGLVNDLKKSLLIKAASAGGAKQALACKLYLSKTYGNKNDLESLFEGIDGIYFIDDAYLHHSVSRLKSAAKNPEKLVGIQEREVENWRSFFVRLGVETVLRTERGSEDDDVCSEDLAKLLEVHAPARASRLLRLLDDHWSRYQHQLEFERFEKQRNRKISRGKQPTSFAKLLRESDWLPTLKHNGCKPRDVCLNTPEARGLFADSIPLLEAELSDDSDLGLAQK